MARVLFTMAEDIEASTSTSFAIRYPVDEHDCLHFAEGLQVLGHDVYFVNWLDLPVGDAAEFQRMFSYRDHAFVEPLAVSDFDLIFVYKMEGFYFQLERFFAMLDRFSANFVVNDIATIKHNIDKHYLWQLEDAGIAVIPTFKVAAVRQRIAAGEKFVLKPRHGERGKNVTLAQSAGDLTVISGDEESYIAQQYMAEIRDGERSLVYLGHQFEHAVIKHPSAADMNEFRCNESLGGTVAVYQPTDEEIAFGQAVLKAYEELGCPVRFSRIDIINVDGKPVLLEAELLNPSIYANYSGRGKEFGESLGRYFDGLLKQRLKKILLLSPTSRERTQLPAIAAKLGCELIFDDFDEDYFDEFLGESFDVNRPTLDIVALIENIIEKYKDANLAGVTSAVGYPGMSASSVIARALNLPGPPPEAIMLCEHKFYSREYQAKLVPEATPAFALIDPAFAGESTGSRQSDREALGFPSFLKPVKSCMSKNAFTVHSREELDGLVGTAVLPRQFVEPFDQMVQRYTGFSQHAACLLHEELLTGVQVSLEGYVFNGAVHVMGVVDAIMFDGTKSFKRWQYPSKLPAAVLARMADIAERFFSGIKYDNALFNMELFYDAATDRIGIIEINPKIASQFPNLFEKVDGFSTYGTLLEVAAGLNPVVYKGKGEYKIAASCVMRVFSDQLVRSVPTRSQIDEILELYPGSRVQIYAQPGKRLSEQAQDAFSYRYGLIDLGAQSESELEEKFDKCMSILQFDFEPVGLISADLS